MTLQESTIFLYNITLIPMTMMSLFFIFLSIIYLTTHKKEKPMKLPDKLPFVSVQVPSYNDPIAVRCVQKCMEFDYPKDKYEIVIVDDSTNLDTQRKLKALADGNKGFIKYIHRDNRQGYKPGALKNAMKYTKGEIIVIFDADWIPKRDFLKKVVPPFSDPKVAIVQTRQGFYNIKTNLITRFAAYTLMVYHTIVMPINSKANCVFFCGTAGALRRKYFMEVGGWNTESITEDSDLSVRLLRKGYTSVYLEHETPSEVPDTFEGFIKQQMRWSYGNTRVFIDNAGHVLYKRGLTMRQRFMILYITLGNLIAPVVVLMTLFGMLGWFVGDPALFNPQDLFTMVSRFLLTAGFLAMGIITLYKQGRLKEFKYLLASTFTVGIILAFATTYAVIKAFFNSKLDWFCTPKTDNVKVVAE